MADIERLAAASQVPRRVRHLPRLGISVVSASERFVRAAAGDAEIVAMGPVSLR